MPDRRVAVTGLGVICALGRNVSEVWKALSEGRSAIRPITQVDVSTFRFRNGAEVPDYQPTDYFDEKELTLLDRFAQLAMAAAAEAVADSGIEWTPGLRQRSAVITGCSGGGKSTEDAGFYDLYAEKRPRVNPMTIPRCMPNAGTSQICMKYGLTGPAWAVSTACSSANHAIGQALWLLRSGAADLAIAGGCEAPFSTGFLKAWEAMRVVSPDTCRPFSKDRKGMILGEGAGMLVLEPVESARARGAKIYAELAGFGMSSDAHHITQPSLDGPASAMRGALADGGIDRDAVDYINAHGTATPANDVTETAAIRAVFGDHTSRVAVSSTKSMHGHALGAAGAIEAVATILGLHHGIIPPTANFTEPDPQCDLDVIPNEARRSQVDCALSNSFAFGGLNAVLAFRRL
jgi:nodulation protein E